jgi:hypothetical protein
MDSSASVAFPGWGRRRGVRRVRVKRLALAPYRWGMTAHPFYGQEDPQDRQDRPRAGAPFLPVPEKNPRAIRAALLPEDLAGFDREYRAVMAEAMETLDLNPVTAFVERWWRVAWSSADPGGHRAMLADADRLIRGEHVPTAPMRETLAELGL